MFSVIGEKSMIFVFYALKTVIRSWKLFLALFLGVILSTTLFAGINIGADTSARQALNQQLDTILVDAYASGGILSSQNWSTATTLLSTINDVEKTEIISRGSAGLLIGNSTKSTLFSIAGIERESKVYDGLTVYNGSTSLNANETYVVQGSKDQSKLSIGDSIILSLPITMINRNGTKITTTFIGWKNVTWRVAGFVTLTDQALSLALRRQTQILRERSSRWASCSVLMASVERPTATRWTPPLLLRWARP